MWRFRIRYNAGRGGKGRQPKGRHRSAGRHPAQGTAPGGWEASCPRGGTGTGGVFLRQLDRRFDEPRARRAALEGRRPTEFHLRISPMPQKGPTRPGAAPWQDASQPPGACIPASATKAAAVSVFKQLFMCRQAAVFCRRAVGCLQNTGFRGHLEHSAYRRWGRGHFVLHGNRLLMAQAFCKTLSGAERRHWAMRTLW